jgi:CheY-like chemotaxis protein
MYSAESLRELGFSVLEAAEALSALRILDHHPEIKLLFTDVGLPGLNGRELVDKARVNRPELRVLFTTGYARNAIVHQGRLDPGVELLTKPFTRGQLAERVRNILDTKIVRGGPRGIALIVEDETLVRTYLAELISEFGFEVIEASTAREGLAAAERTSDARLAIVDIGLPDRSGLELASDLLERWPGMHVVIASGYGQQALAKFVADKRAASIAKPFDSDTVGAALRELGLIA